MAEYQEPKQNNTTRNIIIAVAVVIFLCCCCIVAIWAGLLLMGPAVGNVFSNVIQELEVTPVP
jgi:flagellar basal body-associated protein FliL